MWEELESDFSVFHRIDDPYSLPGPVFVARLRQLVHYRGAVRGRALAELESSRTDPTGVPDDGRPLLGGRGMDAPTGDRAELYRPSFGMAPVIEVGK